MEVLLELRRLGIEPHAEGEKILLRGKGSQPPLRLQQAVAECRTGLLELLSQDGRSTCRFCGSRDRCGYRLSEPGGGWVCRQAVEAGLLPWAGSGREMGEG
ncbi:MAG: hypothetical protein M3072_00460 [Candidatus Dormibacteraeota bacterium]|nr:hypothetical protein [Candidatus Dormibacteraeota bacterium]